MARFLTRRIESLEKDSHAGKAVHRPETADDLLELLECEPNPVFVIGEKKHTVGSFLAEVRQTGRPLVRQEEGS